jgi:hypothetical protein
MHPRRCVLVMLIGSILGAASLVAVAQPATAARRPRDACDPPAKVVGSPAETAWRLWVAAHCPVNADRYPFVVWENWIEQSQMYPLNPSRGLEVPNAGATTPPHPLRPSALGTINGLPVDPATQCTLSMSHRLICEEVRLNGTQEDYVAGRGLWNRAVQQQLAAAGADIQFPKPAVEMKIDWIVLSTCSNPPSGVHVERINGTCFALAGMHLISKLRKNWIWATFEPQNLTTNPQRCVALGCRDPFGSRPAVSRGGSDGFTKLSRKLANLMTNANLAAEWRNYRMDGVQVAFVRANGKPTLLGNSIIEAENAGVPLDQASCISCHAVSSINANGTDGITLLTTNPVGRPKPLPGTDWIRRDFVWSLTEACFNSPFQTCPSP